jgi:hypothetical protein
VSESRAERRRKARLAERVRHDGLDEVLEQPRLPAFEAPASGTVVERDPAADRPREPPRTDEPT